MNLRLRFADNIQAVTSFELQALKEAKNKSDHKEESLKRMHLQMKNCTKYHPVCEWTEMAEDRSRLEEALASNQKSDRYSANESLRFAQRRSLWIMKNDAIPFIVCRMFRNGVSGLLDARNAGDVCAGPVASGSH